MKDNNKNLTLNTIPLTQYTGVSVVVQPAGLGVVYRSENPTDFQLFDDYDVSILNRNL